MLDLERFFGLQNNAVSAQAIRPVAPSINRLVHACAGLVLSVLPLTSFAADTTVQLLSPQFPKVAADPIVLTATENVGVAQALVSIINAKKQPLLQQADFQNRAADMAELYQAVGYKLLWLGQANADKTISDALTLLDNAAADGLLPERYEVALLKQKLPAALALPVDSYQQLAAFDTALSLSVLRYLHDVHYGRVDPKAVNFDLKLRTRKLIDLPSLLTQQLAQGKLLALPELAAPKFKQYQKLKVALARYRTLAEAQQGITVQASKVISPSQATELTRFLTALGDMPESGAGGLTAAIKNFQHRHGLNADGVLGKGTVAAMNAPARTRVGQIELAMERLRWLPEPSAGASLIVNIPAFQLWAFDDVDEFNADMPNMRVVVGKALENQTPVLMAKMSFIDFMPYWNVPYNIVKEEILPKLIKNPNYLASQNMELVSTFSNESKAVGFSGSTITRLKQGSLRVRQRPGKKNALGKVKFMFPNKNDVYMHDTPAHALFGKARRDFSHGCVRLANPERLAEFALKDQWSKETIQEALNTQKTRRVVLKKSIPVLFFYTTAFIDHDDKLAFYADVYQYDSILQEALTKAGDLSDQAIFVQPPKLQPVQAITAQDFLAPIATAIN